MPGKLNNSYEYRNIPEQFSSYAAMLLMVIVLFHFPAFDTGASSYYSCKHVYFILSYIYSVRIYSSDIQAVDGIYRTTAFLCTGHGSGGHLPGKIPPETYIRTAVTNTVNHLVDQFFGKFR